MGFFSKKKAGKKDGPGWKKGSGSGPSRGAANSRMSNSSKPAASTQSKSDPPPPATQQKVIKIVGDEKHVTATTTDPYGRLVSETTVTKLTPTERIEHQQQSKVPQLNVYQPNPAPVTQERPTVADSAQQQNFCDLPQQQERQRLHHSVAGGASSSAASSNGNSSAMNLSATNNDNTNNNNNNKLDVNSHSDDQATIETTRDLVKRFISDIWNRGEIELIPEVCHPSLRFNGHVGMNKVGHEGFARMVASVRDALTEYHCEIHSMVVEKNKAFCRLRFTGKHTGVLLGFPPTGKTVAWMGASEFTCKNGKILKVWELGDVKGLEEQLKNGQ